MHLEIQNWEKGEYCDCKWFLPLVTKRCWSVSDLEQGQKTRAGSHSWVPLFPSGTQQPTILHNIAQYCTILKNTHNSTILQNNTTLHNISKNTTTQYYNTAQHCTILQNTHNNTILQHSTTLHNIAKHTQQHNIKHNTTFHNIAKK